ncbi:MAG: bi-domain-containing oxidoreductase [Hyphomicrobiaceae bacterium]
MKQVLQSLKTGATEIADVPCPSVGRGQLLIRTTRSLVSSGTERMIVDFGKAGWIDKARQQPDKVRMVLDKAKSDGIVPTIEAVRNKLDQTVPLGYCNVGRVLEVGAGVTGFAVGDRVASNGRHAEIVSVPVNLCARIPDAVSDDEAAFTVVGAIALQGLRLATPTLGETVVVTGLGLIGLMAVQLLCRSNGCRVLGIDFDRSKLDLARTMGAEVVDLAAGEDPVAAAERFSRGRGVDAVIVTAATKSSEPMHQAALMCRKRGRIVLVGVTGLELSRADFYEKELSFQVSCSYGPGRYDPLYEEKGQDYPVGFVRWTEQRNFEAILDAMSARQLEVASLVSHRYPIGAADEAYGLLGSGAPSLGVMLDYAPAEDVPDANLRRNAIRLGAAAATASSTASPAQGTVASAAPPSLGFMGSGNFASIVLMPAFKQAGARLTVVASAAGVTGLQAARKHGFAETTTDTASVFARPDVDAVVIATRHDSHARLVVAALRAGKHVFVEKPLALTTPDLDAIAQAYGDAAQAAGRPPVLAIGFNRRFAPHVRVVKQLLDGTTGPKAFVMTVNAGQIPASHWTQDREIGGGRIVGEACHFIDLLRFLAGAPITSHAITYMDAPSGDTATVQLAFADGSIGTVHYFANGSRAYPKETLEVFAAGRVLRLENYLKVTGYGWPGMKRTRAWRQDKGYNAFAAAFVAALAGKAPAPIAFDEVMEVSRIAIDLAHEGK